MKKKKKKEGNKLGIAPYVSETTIGNCTYGRGLAK